MSKDYLVLSKGYLHANPMKPSKRRTKFPFILMKIGDHFTVSGVNEIKNAYRATRVANEEMLGRHFEAHAIGQGFVRVTRVPYPTEFGPLPDYVSALNARWDREAVEFLQSQLPNIE